MVITVEVGALIRRLHLAEGESRGWIAAGCLGTFISDSALSDVIYVTCFEDGLCGGGCLKK